MTAVGSKSGVGLVLDTQTVAWSLTGDPSLPKRTRSVIAAAVRVHVCAASLYEIAYKAGRGRWPEMEPYLDGLERRVVADGAILLPATATEFVRAATLDWPHRDPFDRLVAATALVHGLDLVSSDAAFDTLPGLHRVW